MKKVGDPRQYRCTACHKTLLLSTAVWAFLIEHANWMKHKDAFDKRQNVFKPIPKNVAPNVSSNIDINPLQRCPKI